MTLDLLRRYWPAAAIALAGVLGYGFGRYASPAKVETKTVTQIQTQVEYRDRVVEKVVQGPVRTVTHTVERLVPCGTAGEPTPTTDTTITVEAGPVVTDRQEASDGTGSSTTKIETRTVTVYSQPRLMLQAGGSTDLGLALEWSAGASYRLVGPVWLGAAYQSPRRIEVRASLTF